MRVFDGLEDVPIGDEADVVELVESDVMDSAEGGGLGDGVKL